MDKKYAYLAADETLKLLAIDSPSGFTEKAAAWVCGRFSELGYERRQGARRYDCQDAYTRRRPPANAAA